MVNYIGSIIGDYAGSVYEFNNFDRDDQSIESISITPSVGYRYTDDTVCTIAVMDWLNECGGKDSEVLIDKLKEWGNRYPKVGYGGMFAKWLGSDNRGPIGSYGNGSAMRVSPVAFYAKTFEECLELAERSAMVTHDHEEGVKGAKAIAVAIYLARIGFGKAAIGQKLTKTFEYNLSKELCEIGTASHRFDATCKVTVPEALTVFLKTENFESAIRTAIWIGGDSDTIAAMVGGIAEAYYGLPLYLSKVHFHNLPEDMRNVVIKFNYTILDQDAVPESFVF